MTITSPQPDEELKDLLTKMATKKLKILEFTTRLNACQKRLGSAFDSEFQEAINSVLVDLGKDPVSAEGIRDLKAMFSKEAK
jgi:hypothetical protein